MKKTLSILILLLILSCDKSDYKTIDFGSFEITVPKKWNEYEIKGIDSYVGGIITDKNDTLIFDIGAYSPDLTKNNEVMVYDSIKYKGFSETQKRKLKLTRHMIVGDWMQTDYNPKDFLKYQFKIDSIDCFLGKYITPINNGFGASGIYIDSLKGGGPNSNKTRLSFYGNSLSDSTQAEFFKALKNIRLTKYCE